jgi:hypothetical protein
VEDALMAGPPDRVVSCFEVVEHLATFVPLLEWAAPLARAGAATFVLNAPNHAVRSSESPSHETVWDEGAFEALLRLLPPERTLVRQVTLTGSALVDWAAPAAPRTVPVRVGGAPAVATHFIAAFGPRHRQLGRGARVIEADLLEQRRWERQRESDLALAEAMVTHQNERFAAWRAYTHELERELGRPLSGVEPDRQPAPPASPPGP